MLDYIFVEVIDKFVQIDSIIFIRNKITLKVFMEPGYLLVSIGYFLSKLFDLIILILFYKIISFFRLFMILILLLFNWINILLPVECLCFISLLIYSLSCCGSSCKKSISSLYLYLSYLNSFTSSSSRFSFIFWYLSNSALLEYLFESCL